MLGNFEAAMYTVFAHIPLVVVIAIPLYIIGIIKRKKNQNPRKYFIMARTLFGVLMLWFIVLFIVGMIGFAPGRFDS